METNLEKLKQYFLVTLSPQEMEDIDLRIISDIDFAAELDAAETALLEDYLENSLSAGDRKLFETNYLVTQDRQNKLSFLGSLKSFAQQSSKQPKLQENPSSFFDSIKSLFAPRKLAFGLGVVALILIGGIIWRTILPGDTVSGEIVLLNKKDLSNLDEFRETGVISLIPVNLRSGGETKTLEANKLSESVLVRLSLPLNTPIESAFQFNLMQDKKMIATINQPRVYSNNSGQELRLLIPTSTLKKGEYQIELKSLGDVESRIIYSFLVR